jgi:hypothetical protein
VHGTATPPRRWPVRVADAIQERIVIVVQVVEAVLQLDSSGGRVVCP